MLLATEKKLTWDGRSIARGESLPSIFRKVAFRNRVSILELLNLVGSEGESLRYSKIKFPARSNYFRALTGCPEDILTPTLTHYLLGEITPQLSAVDSKPASGGRIKTSHFFPLNRS